MAVGSAFVQPPAAEAVTASARTKFIAKLVGPAQSAQRKFGVPASVSIAQAIVASDWGTSSQVETARNYFGTECSAAMTAGQFAKLAEAQLGKPYVLGAEAAISNPNPPKFDCSELVEWLYGRSGNKITDLAASQYNVTRRVTGSPRVGDLVFLRNNPARSNGIGHVAVLTRKRADGDWEIVEARGRAYGVVRSTLSYWKNRSYYAGLRRYSKFVLVDGESVTASAAGDWKSGCVTIGKTSYSSFSSITNSFYANAAAIADDAAYKPARAVMASVPKFVEALAKVVRPKDAADYADTLADLIDDHHLTDYDVVPMSLVLTSGDKGWKVTGLQWLLKAAGFTTGTTGSYDAATVSAVRKFQRAKKLEVDGEAGPITLNALFATVEPGDSGKRVQAVHALLAGLGYATTAGDHYGADTRSALTWFQRHAGRTENPTIDKNTWAALFMGLESSSPKIEGTPRFGKTLTVQAGDWGPGSVALSYQWYRGGQAVSGATGSSYELGAADVKQPIKVLVTGMRTGYTVTARGSAATGPVEPATLKTTPTPKVSGTAQVGQTLTAKAGAWEPEPVTLAYQWKRDGKAIEGATATTYALQPADAGTKVSVTVTGSRPGYASVAKTSAATGDVAKGTLASATPRISGEPRVGAVLKAVPGTWGPDGVGLGYQWKRAGKPIEGATAATYTVQAADAGATLSVTVTGTLPGYTTVAKTSAATAKVAKGTLTGATPKITGERTVGEVLKAVPGSWGPDGVELGYQWFSGNDRIAGATSASLKLTKAMRGHTVSVRVVGRLAGYEPLAKKSAKTGLVR